MFKNKQYVIVTRLKNVKRLIVRLDCTTVKN